MTEDEPIRKGDGVDVERAASAVLSTWIKIAVARMVIFFIFLVFLWQAGGVAVAAAFGMGFCLKALIQ
jgi:hypothetical protein